jgi:hypothetical protein
VNFLPDGLDGECSGLTAGESFFFRRKKKQEMILFLLEDLRHPAVVYVPF